MQMIYLSTLTTVVSVLAVYFLTRKFWWAPLFGIFKELVWIVWVLQVEGGWPLLGACLTFIVIYASAAPRWYRTRKQEPAEAEKKPVGPLLCKLGPGGDFITELRGGK